MGLDLQYPKQRYRCIPRLYEIFTDSCFQTRKESKQLETQSKEIELLNTSATENNNKERKQPGAVGRTLAILAVQVAMESL